MYYLIYRISYSLFEAHLNIEKKNNIERQLNKTINICKCIHHNQHHHLHLFLLLIFS